MATLTHDAEEIASLQKAARISGIEIPEFVAPRDEHVVLRGMRFHYLDWGSEGKQRILWLHGGGLNAHTYDLVCLALRTGHHCISLDQRGHGDSEWSPIQDYDTETQAEDILAFVEHLGWDRYIQIGMSMGGLNSIRFAGQHANKLAALVLIDVGPELQAPGTGRIAQFRESTKREIDSLDEYIAEAVKFNPLRDPEILRRSLLHNLRRTPAGKWVWKWDPRPRLGGNVDWKAMAERRALLWDDVATITCPTLVVRGTESDVFSEENAAKLVERLPRATYARVEKAGHTVQGDNPAGLVRELRKFFGSLEL